MRSYKIPSIIRLKVYVRGRQKPIIRFCRENVYLRDNHACQYCSQKKNIRDLTLDHVLPVSKGGKKSWMNVVTACRSCNQKKRNRTPEQAEMPLLKAPTVPKWLPNTSVDVNSESVPASWRTYLGSDRRATSKSSIDSSRASSEDFRRVGVEPK